MQPPRCAAAALRAKTFIALAQGLRLEAIAHGAATAAQYNLLQRKYESKPRQE
jgi:hypothetical protein